MRLFFLLPILALIIFACSDQPNISSINPINWQKRNATSLMPDSLQRGR